MTIALGILASDGIVLAADTELSWGDVRKTEGAKIAIWPNEGLAIAGAGNANYIEALSERVHAAVQRHTTPDVTKIRRDVQAALVKFHYDHILPWNDPTLDVDLLIALRRGAVQVLWVTYKTTMRPCVCAAIGSGSVEADSLFVQFFNLTKRPSLDLVTAQVMATHLAHVAKERIPGCGKNTDVVLITNGSVEQLSRGDVNGLESCVGDVLELQTRAAQFAYGYVRVEDEVKEHEAAQHLAKFFLSIRREYQQMAHFRSTSRRWTLGIQSEEGSPPATTQPSVSSSQIATPPAPRRSRRGRTRRPPSRA